MELRRFGESSQNLIQFEAHHALIPIASIAELESVLSCDKAQDKLPPATNSIQLAGIDFPISIIPRKPTAYSYGALPLGEDRMDIVPVKRLD